MGREYLLERAVGGDASGLDEEGLRGEAPDFGEVVRDVEDGDAAAAKASDDLGFGGGVEGGERLVEQEQAWARRESAGNGDALAFSAGEARWFAVAERLSVDEGEYFVDAVAAFGGRQMAQAEGDVFRHRAVRKERGALRNKADVAAARRDEDATCGVEKRQAIERDAALLRGGEPGEDAEEGAFASGGGPEEDGPGRGRIAGDAEVDFKREVAIAVGDVGIEERGVGKRGLLECGVWERGLWERVRHGSAPGEGCASTRR